MPLTGERKRQYQREWKATRRAEFLEGKSCVRCGSTTDLQVDHIDPTKKIHHNVWSWSEERRQAELAKCQILCTPCHREKSLAEQGGPSPHGTWKRYSRHGCRCDPCKAASRDRSRERRRRTRAGS